MWQKVKGEIKRVQSVGGDVRNEFLQNLPKSGQTRCDEGISQWNSGGDLCMPSPGPHPFWRFCNLFWLDLWALLNFYSFSAWIWIFVEWYTIVSGVRKYSSELPKQSQFFTIAAQKSLFKSLNTPKNCLSWLQIKVRDWNTHKL